jgi:hypothetical protein
MPARKSRGEQQGRPRQADEHAPCHACHIGRMPVSKSAEKNLKNRLTKKLMP